MTLLMTNLDGRITLKGALGSGGMGEVHRAWDAALERAVAVKFVRSGDPKEADRLLLEARLQARVEHPHVVRVLDTGTLEGRPCIVMQLIEGSTFADFAAEPRWQPKVALAAQAARGLGAAHRMGLVHRDVKPANLLVEETGEGPQARLSDFGLARDEEGGLTRSGMLVGTVDFMAPEQVAGLAPVDFRADIYGMGASLYAVLSGRPPFRASQAATAAGAEGLSDGITPQEIHPGDLLRRLMEDEPVALASCVPGLPKELSIVVAKAMEKDPGLRYPTAEAFAEDLERILRGEPVQARSASWLDRGLRWARRNRTAARVAAAALLLLVLGLTYTLIASRRATLEALASARMGAEAAAMESGLRREWLLPSHDLRPALTAIRRRLEVLGGQRGSEAPRAYAIGRGHQLLGDWSSARAQLERARHLGFRTPEGDLAYGLVLAELYREALAEARTIPDVAIRRRRMETLHHDLLTPAVASIQTQAAALPDRSRQLLGQVALLEGRLQDALGLAQEAQTAPEERAEALLLEARIHLERRETAYTAHDHDGALKALDEGLRALGAAREIARSDSRVAGLRVRCGLLKASHQRSLGLPTEATLDQAFQWLEEARDLHGDEADLAILEATLLQRRGMAKRDGGKGSFEEDAQALDLLRKAAAAHPDRSEIHRFLSNACYSLAYARVSAGQEASAIFEEGRRAVAGARKVAPLDWRLPYTGALLAQPESVFLNNRGRDAREVARRGIAFAEEAILLGAGPNAKGIRGDLRVELARAQYGAGEDPADTLQRLQADASEGVASAPKDQIMRVNAGLAAALIGRLRRVQGQAPGEVVDLGLSWLEGINPSYIEGHRARLDLQLLKAESGPIKDRLSAADRILQDIQAAERTVHGTLSYQTGCAFRLKAQASEGPSSASAFQQARLAFRRMEKEDPSNLEAAAEVALTALQELHLRPGAARDALFQEVQEALARGRALSADHPLLLGLEAARLRVASRFAFAEQRASLAQEALQRWRTATGRSALLAKHPFLAELFSGA